MVAVVLAVAVVQALALPLLVSVFSTLVVVVVEMTAMAQEPTILALLVVVMVGTIIQHQQIPL
jgi:hypothetical protein